MTEDLPISYQRQLGELKVLADELNESSAETLARVRQARRHVSRRDGPDTSTVDDGPEQPVIVFVHIPKTAGATALNMLAGAYSKKGLTDAGNFITGPDKVLTKLRKGPEGWETWSGRGGRVVAGHVPYAIFRDHLPPDARYMTFLREPVDRVLSHYFRHVHVADIQDRDTLADRIKQYQEEGTARAGSLEEALVDMRMIQLSNFLTRLLSGNRSPTGELAPSALDEAKANLGEFAFVGIQERFEESIVLLQRTFGLGLLPYWNRHVNVLRPGIEEISDEQLALIREHNQLDLELYRYASELFEDAVRAEDDTFAADVERLRGLAAEANEEAIEKAQEWLEDKLPPGSVKLTNELRAEGIAAGFPAVVLKNARTRVERARRGSHSSPAQSAAP
jgi:hypothetical protein